MSRKIYSIQTKGMNRDLSVSKFNQEFSYENKNLRLSTYEHNTQMSWVTEKGPKEVPLSITPFGDNGNSAPLTQIEGIPIGTAVIDHQLVLFTTTNTTTNQKEETDDAAIDRIYCLGYTEEDGSYRMAGKVLYEGHLNFSTRNPLNTLVSYESNLIKKVYWTDGRNQPRLLNIEEDYYKDGNPFDGAFDFTPELQLKETVTVKKQIDGNGSFAAGVIQYAFTYYNNHAQETNIFYVTPLYAISFKDRGAAPDEQVGNTFKITIDHVDAHFDYLRIYSIQRTSLDGDVIVKRVQDIELKEWNAQKESDGLFYFEPITYVDNGRNGETIDATELLYKNRDNIIAGTFEQKDGTLFLGNLKLEQGKFKDYEDRLKGCIENVRNKFQMNPPQAQPLAVSDTRSIVAFDATTKDGSSATSATEANIYNYANQLTACPVTAEEASTVSYDAEKSVTPNGFKKGDYYRLGLQFQYKNGKWGNPLYIGDFQQENRASTKYIAQGLRDGNGDIITTENLQKVTLPTFTSTLPWDIVRSAIDCGYKRVRPVCVFPAMQERTVLCQGIISPTIYTKENRNNSAAIYAQSSWFFRYTDGLRTSVDSSGAVIPYFPSNVSSSHGSLTLSDKAVIPYIEGWDSNNNSTRVFAYNPNNANGFSSGAINNIRQVEIEGYFDDNTAFRSDYEFVTFHSPDLIFNSQYAIIPYTDLKYQKVGQIAIDRTLSDIDIQTETPTISSLGSGFVHKSFNAAGNYGIVSGLFYDDFLVDDWDDKTIGRLRSETKACKWMVYLWNKSGSLNNDINRPSAAGTQSAKLKKKVVCNLRFSQVWNTTNFNADDYSTVNFTSEPQLFSSNEVSVVKVNGHIYEGNIDTLITPTNSSGKFFATSSKPDSVVVTDSWSFLDKDIVTTYSYDALNITQPAEFADEVHWVTNAQIVSEDADSNSKKTTVTAGLWYGNNETTSSGGTTATYTWNAVTDKSAKIGDYFTDLVIKKEGIRMKYKSTPHLVMQLSDSDVWTNGYIPVLELCREPDTDSLFGGTTEDALKANKWVVCGDPVELKYTEAEDSTADNPIYEEIKVKFSYGDTYFQRYDCLKTYPYTKEDENQVVEILSFMCETKVNIDGRYDRNRGNVSNLNVDPTNFNLINDVYSQTDNYFTYRMLSEEDYSNNTFPNQITYSLTKQPGATVDEWTQLTLANILEMDGDKGDVSAIERLNNNLIVFQDHGIAQVLYNENVQISSTQGVPIEIANSQKVQGKRYITETIGCSDAHAIGLASTGLYFIDSNDKSFYLFNGQLTNLSVQKGFDSWSKQTLPNSTYTWTPDKFENFAVYYDKLDQDLLLIGKDTALAYSEKMQQFTSFFDYDGTPYFVNVDHKGIWIRWDAEAGCRLYSHQDGEYLDFWGEKKPYWMTLISNAEPTQSKIFTNLTLRATVDGDGEDGTNKFNFYQPFDSIEVWNEYQHGISSFRQREGRLWMEHDTVDKQSTLKRKFRIWRNDLPRDNAPMEGDAALNISRVKERPLDRIRNPWIYLKLMKDAEETMHRAEIHDIAITYYDY